MYVVMARWEGKSNVQCSTINVDYYYYRRLLQSTFTQNIWISDDMKIHRLYAIRQTHSIKSCLNKNIVAFCKNGQTWNAPFRMVMLWSSYPYPISYLQSPKLYGRLYGEMMIANCKWRAGAQHTHTHTHIWIRLHFNWSQHCNM